MEHGPCLARMVLFASFAELREFTAGKIPPKLRAHIDADDIMQNLHLEMLACGDVRLETYEEAIRYLKTGLYNEIRDACRTYGRKKRGGGGVLGEGELVDNTVAVVLEEMARYERTPSESAMSHEAHMEVERAIQSLPNDQANALRLRYIDRLSAAAIAVTMNRTEGAIHQLCHRALAGLRKELWTPSIA